MAELVSLVAQVHELSDFLQWTHIEPVGTHFEPPSLSPWLTELVLFDGVSIAYRLEQTMDKKQEIQKVF